MMRMTVLSAFLLRRLLGLPLSVGLVVALLLAFTVACDRGEGGAAGAEGGSSAAVATAPASVLPAAGSSAPAGRRPPPARRHAGLGGMLLRGAYELTLTNAQQAEIQKLEEIPAGSDAGVVETPTPWAAHKTFEADLVAGIREAKLDTGKLRADYATIDRATQSALAREAAALDGLHAVLDATQRQTLVDQVKARRAAHPPARMTAPDGGAVDWAKRRLDRSTSELGLDDAQKKAVAALIAREPMTPASIQARRDATQKRVDAMLAEFVKDTFSAEKLDLSLGGKTPHDGEEQQAAFVAAILPLLHPDQREKLAVHTERMSNRPMRNTEDGEQMPSGVDDEGPIPPRLLR